MKHFYISEKVKMDMSVLLCNDPYTILANVFASFPLPLKHHCIQTGAVSGLMAEHVQNAAIPEDLTLEEYANAVRYGGFYHDIAAYLVHNEYEKYPEVGYKLLAEQINENKVPAAIRTVILDTVYNFAEHFDGSGYPASCSGDAIPLHAGLCAIANAVDMFLSRPKRFGRRGRLCECYEHIKAGVGSVFTPAAWNCFDAAWEEISALYRQWASKPPMWKFSDLKPEHSQSAK